MIGLTMHCSEPVAVPMIGSQHTLRSPPAQRSSRRLSDFRCAAIPSAVVWRAKRSQQCNRLRQVFEPFAQRSDSRL